MRSYSLLIFLVVYTSAEELLCQRESLADFYEELGCTPNFENDSLCPTSYDCKQHENRDKTKCYYEGKSYNEGEDIGDVTSACAAACRCSTLEPNTTPTITCANVECPEQFGPRPGPKCYSVHDHESCCQKTSVCIVPVEAHPPRTCQYGNATYYEGQRFYPSETPCKRCLCMANFTGELGEPFCKEIKCHNQLRNLQNINEGCVPVYYGDDGCCPIEWKCPQKEDKVQAARTKEGLKTTESCRFGSLMLQPGDALEPHANAYTNVDCSCQLPPYLTCISKPIKPNHWHKNKN